MARYGHHPENALKRATELIEVGKPDRALDTLYEVFKNKKWMYSWGEGVLEPIMIKFLKLCVELNKPHIAKEGLFQYRNLFQAVNVGSLENVIRFYLRRAKERTEEARQRSQQATVDVVDDLDNLVTPEEVLLRAVSGDDAQDRSDQAILTPWLKFLWESYCVCLDLLRSNYHAEALYHDVTRMAFHFCLKYCRKTEFRKLCEKLRKHMDELQKLSPQNVWKVETQQLILDTHHVQLNSAVQMELWQEAYKTIEDIHGLMNLTNKPPTAKTMANYYHKFALVFWKAGNYLFHAAALLKLFQLSKEMKKNITPEELHKMACRVLIATLSVPLPSARPEFFIETDKSPREKEQRLTVLLGLLQPPTRQSLLRDVVRLNVVGLSSPPLQELHRWLEVEFHPLRLCGHLVVEQLRSEEALIQYLPALQDVTLTRLISQVSQVYQTIEIPRLVEIAKFTTRLHLERLLVDCVRLNDMQIRIDHRGNCIHFGTDLSQREDSPVLQSLPSKQLSKQLVNMATVLRRATTVIQPHQLEREEMKAQMVQHYQETKFCEHRQVLARCQIIEERKEHLERLQTERVEEEARRQEEFLRQQVVAEQKRLDQERGERERRRLENELQHIKDRHLKEKIQQISQTYHGQRILKKLEEDDIKSMDVDQVVARELEELQKERRELQRKLKSQEKKVDHLERAKRLEEIPLLRKTFEEKKEQGKRLWEQLEKERIEALVEQRRRVVETCERMLRMKQEMVVFTTQLQSQRKSQFMSQLQEYEREVGKRRQRLMANRKLQRKEERRAMWLQQREEERKRQEEAQLEAERLYREEEETAEKQREERQCQQEALERQCQQKALDRQLEKEERRPVSQQPAQTKSWRSRPTSGQGCPEPERSRPADNASKRRPAEGGDWRSKRTTNPNNLPYAGSVSFVKPEAESRDRASDMICVKPEPWRGSAGGARDRPRPLPPSAGPGGFVKKDVKRPEGARSWRQKNVAVDDDPGTTKTIPRISEREPNKGGETAGHREGLCGEPSSQPRNTRRNVNNFGNWRRDKTGEDWRPPEGKKIVIADVKLQEEPPVEVADEEEDGSWKIVTRK